MRDSICVFPHTHSFFCNLNPGQSCRGLEHFPASPWQNLLSSFFLINSSSSNSDPARVVRMSRQTYLPAGMEGVIICPVQADPPVLYVNWTKDGNDLNLDNVSYGVKKYNV